MRVTCVSLLAVVLGVPTLARAATWQIDPVHSAAQFSARHMMVSNVQGEFGKVTGTVNIDDKDITKTTIEATIDVSTINTREPKRDAHLKSPDFFDVAKYPTMTFKSTSVKRASGAPGGENKLVIVGDLT